MLFVSQIQFATLRVIGSFNNGVRCHYHLFAISSLIVSFRPLPLFSPFSICLLCCRYYSLIVAICEPVGLLLISRLLALCSLSPIDT